MKRVAIVGGGLAGISAARYAQEAGLYVEIFESSDRCGGRVAHDVVDGLVIDHGFQVINFNYPELKKLLKKDVASKPIFSRFTFVSGATRSTLSAFNPLSWLVNLSVITKIYSNFITGVFLMDPRQVSKEVSRRIVKYFVKGRPHLVDGGVGTIIPTLLDGIPSSQIHLNTRVTEVVKAEAGLIIRTDNSNLPADTFDYVVIATNGGVGSIRGTSGGNSRHWNASTTVYHSTRKDLSQFNQLILGENFTNSLVISNANPTYSSDSRSLIATTYLGSIDETGWEKVGIEKTAEIASLYGLKPEDLDLVSVQNIPYSLPSFSTSEPRSLSIVDSNDSRIVYAGDAFDEPSQNGALRSGRAAVEKLLSH